MAEDDYQVMVKWLSTPEVLEFYGGINNPLSLKDIIKKYKPRVEGTVPIIPFIVELDKRPIGYMQTYKLSVNEIENLSYSSNDVIYGMDQFIGDPHFFGKGYGTIMVQSLIEMIVQQQHVDIIALDPEVKNSRAIRCYEKCGFQKVRKIRNDLCWLMEYRIIENCEKSFFQ
jgi:aminoglycoside 6'-N-acetyltransferase